MNSFNDLPRELSVRRIVHKNMAAFWRERVEQKLVYARERTGEHPSFTHSYVKHSNKGVGHCFVKNKKLKSTMCNF